MNVTVAALAFFGAFLAATLGCLEIGRAVGKRATSGARRPAGLGTVENVVFALLGLLLALTLTSAASRFESRRALVAEEANAVGTAWLRIDVLPEDAQPKLRETFRKYAEARLAVHRALPDLALSQRKADEASGLSHEIWADAVAACRRTDPETKLLVLQALNTMIDMAGTRAAALRAHMPIVIYIFLCALSLVSGLFAGFEMGGRAGRSRLHTLGFALLVTSTVYLIVDFEYPRVGVIRLDDSDRALEEVRRAMH